MMKVTFVSAPLLCFLLLLLCTVVGVLPVSAWLCTGHLEVAQVAMKVLKGENSPIVSFLETAITNFATTGPWPQSPDPVQAACWPRDIDGNIPLMRDWQSIYLPYNPENITLSKADAEPSDSNIVNRMVQLFKSLANTSPSPNKWVINFAVVWLIHLFGDIHQPLQTILYFTPEFPTGDMNRFILFTPSGLTYIGGYWESGCETLLTDHVRPLNASAHAQVDSAAEEYLALYGSTITPSELALAADPMEMAKATHQVAIEKAYSNGTLVSGTMVTEEYRKTCIKTVGRQIVLAGKRLARQLEVLLLPLL